MLDEAIQEEVARPPMLDSLIQHRQIIVEFNNDTRNKEFYNNLPMLDEAIQDEVARPPMLDSLIRHRQIIVEFKNNKKK